MKIHYILLVLIPFFNLACSSMDKIDTSTVAGQYKLAEMYEENERYQEAIIQFTEIKNKHPYSRFAVMAELKAADIHFKREAYAEAKLAYQIFRDYHPTHPRTDYVLYQIGMSAFNMLPETIDRDLSDSKEAIQTFEQLVRMFPDSKYSPEARVKRTEIIKKLAEKEFYIAEFYMQHKNYKSALLRYEKILSNYPILGFRPKALMGASISAFESDQSAKAKSYLAILYKDFPQSSEAQSIKNKVEKYGVR